MSELPITYYEGVFRIFGFFAAQIAEVPSTFSQVEQQFLQGLKLAQGTRAACEHAFSAGQRATEIELQQSAKALGKQYRKRSHVLARVLLVCLEMAVRHERISPRADSLLRTLARGFGLGASSYEQLKAHFVRGEISTEVKRAQTERGSKRSAFQILGCPEAASATEIRRCYRQLALQFHPDVYQSLELPQTIRDSIRERFNEIQEAYEYLKAAKDIR